MEAAPAALGKIYAPQGFLASPFLRGLRRQIASNLRGADELHPMTQGAHSPCEGNNALFGKASFTPRVVG
jgi:hypothetical protein